MTAFGISWDYRCPASYVVHSNILDGLDAGADWDVTFLPFSLSQSHVGAGELPIWDRPQDDSGLEALQIAIAVRDTHRDAFTAVHRGLFDLRHLHGRPFDRTSIDGVLTSANVEPDEIWTELASGRPLETIRREHTEMSKTVQMWGVPTFVIGDQAVFVRLNELSNGDGALARRRIDRILDLMTDYPDLNEFKHTSLVH